MPDFPIIDSHVHLYDVSRLRYPWLSRVPRINRTYLLRDFDAARGPVQVDQIVFAEVAVDRGLHLGEAAFVQELADQDRRLTGMVAHAPVENGAAVEEDLAALAKFGLLRGVRRLIETELDQSLCLEPGFLEGVRRVGRHGLTFDICVKHWGMVFALELVRRCPEVQFVLDHIGKPGIKAGLTEPWWQQIRELASLPNIHCKISGVATEADHESWTREQLRPYIAHAIECFGFDRVMFGGDWHVSELAVPYPQWVEIVDWVVEGSSVEEKRKLFHDNAIAFYRLDRPGA